MQKGQSVSSNTSKVMILGFELEVFICLCFFFFFFFFRKSVLNYINYVAGFRFRVVVKLLD